MSHLDPDLLHFVDERLCFKLEMEWLIKDLDPFQEMGIGACGGSPLDDPSEQTEGFDP